MRIKLSNKNHQYLLYSSIMLVIITVVYRIMFNHINGSIGEIILLFTLGLLSWVPPLYLGYKISEKSNFLKYAIFLAVVYLITDMITGATYFHSIETILFGPVIGTIIIFILTYIGATFAKRGKIGEFIYCTKCGVKNPEDSKYCQKCGKSLKKEKFDSWKTSLEK